MWKKTALLCGLLACDTALGPTPADADLDASPAVFDAVAPTADRPTPTPDDFGDPCEEGAQCRSGFCVVVEADSRACTRLCGSDDDCPDGWLCRQVINSGADVALICVPEEAPCAGADLLSDPAHCGACDNVCAFPDAEARCEDGRCAIGPCARGFHDLDGEDANGCEYACLETRGGDETCDDIDNDCDGATDEGFDLATDPDHCGACGRACAPANATGVCLAGRCEVDACLEGFEDADGAPENGCEAGCTPSNDGVEACDRIDNDCDGATDEGFDLATDPAHCGACNAPCALPNAAATCVAGACTLDACLPGFFDRNGDPADGCEVGCQPSNQGLERCDEVDNDCDGLVDEGVDVAEDPENCGRCGARCDRPGGITACRDGACQLVGCRDGFFDHNGDPADGCEVGCAPSNGGVERCDEVDNDCDGLVDEGLDLASDPFHCGACGVRCDRPNAQTACADGVCALLGCNEGFFDRNGDAADGCELACQESNAGRERCDEVDNDCDGLVDEDFDLQADPTNCGTCGTNCASPGAVTECTAGECRRVRCQAGRIDLNGDPDDGCEYGCVPAEGGVEVCNGADDDCDGRADEGFDLDADPAHCGRCDRSCAFENAVPRCDEGLCGVARCAPGFVDANGDPRDGCELACAPANGGVEACNGGDDDCDGRTDEDFAVEDDPENCGACGRACALDHAAAACLAGLCRVAACEAGFGDADGRSANGCECALQNGGVEACNEVDDDCDGIVDEGFDLDRDVAHCGGCGQACDLFRAVPVCVEGACRVDHCADARDVDLDRLAENGCECRRTGAEVCDGQDNDCDGRVEEGFNLDVDVNNCGACGRACATDHATPSCVDGGCRVGQCEPGFVDLNRSPDDGCECAAAGEVCNGEDDDCDRAVDETFDLQNDPRNCGQCGAACVLDHATPRCAEGGCAVAACDEGWRDKNAQPGDGCECQVRAEICNGADDDCDGTADEGVLNACGACGPAPVETCNEVDDDCDDATDESFDLENDPRHCGRCNNACALDNAAERCAAGTCQVAGCDPGWRDLDGRPDTGCECRVEAEACDGRDNDCDGSTDEGVRNACGGCGAVGAEVCNNIDDDCDDRTDEGVQNACGGCGPVPQETCNGRDDDCDDATDEGFNLQIDPSNCGACGRVCALDHAAPTCVAGQCRVASCVDPWRDRNGQPGDGCECLSAAETCNGADDDCDSAVDESFDLQNDPTNCGECGRVCALAHATESCGAGACRVAQCDAGWRDRNGDAGDGCECEVRAEVCNGADDDCDGTADEGVQNACGACGAVPPEICNGADDDCDGSPDENFDLQNDPLNCGACDADCARDHARTNCQAGACAVTACDDGYVDANGDPDDGCEIDCAAQGGGVPECGQDFPYEGTYDVDTPVLYVCSDILFGDEALRVSVQSVELQEGGGVLLALASAGRAEGGGPLATLQMEQDPNPEDGSFRAVADFPPALFGCGETYTLTGDFSDADHFDATLRVAFRGDLCAWTTCVDQLFAFTGTRR